MVTRLEGWPKISRNIMIKNIYYISAFVIINLARLFIKNTITICRGPKIKLQIRYNLDIYSPENSLSRNFTRPDRSDFLIGFWVDVLYVMNPQWRSASSIATCSLKSSAFLLSFVSLPDILLYFWTNIYI